MFNILLQVLDDGRLTDGQGRTVDFTNTVLIMTSNLPGDPQSFFKPEFINRVDDIIRFRSLTVDDLRHIVEIQLEHLQARLADKRIGFEASDAAKHALADTGFDEAFGARPLKRVIQREIGDRACPCWCSTAPHVRAPRSASTPTMPSSRSMWSTPAPDRRTPRSSRIRQADRRSISPRLDRGLAAA